MIQRRSLLIGLASLLAAPAIVRAESLMKLPAPLKIIKPEMKFEAGEIVWTASGGNDGPISILIYDGKEMQPLLCSRINEPVKPGELIAGETYRFTFDGGKFELK